ncbi:MAG: amidohydrolase family protein [Planctomycetota bacterium]
MSITHVTVLALTAGVAFASEPVSNVHLVDPITSRIAENRTILIEGETLTRFEAGNGAWSGLYAVPALIDAHVHDALPQINGPLFIAHGVALVRDLGGETEPLVDLRKNRATGDALGPEMLITGRIIDGDPAVWPFSYPCDEPEDARKAVRELHKAGVDAIKVYSRLMPEVYEAAVEEAGNVGLPVVGHIPDAVPVQAAIAAGQRTAEHMLRLPSEFIDEPRHGVIPDWWWNYENADPDKRAALISTLAASDTAICPTLVVNYGIASAADGTGAQDPRMRFIPAFYSSFWDNDGYKSWGASMAQTHEHKKDFLRRLHEAGGTIIAGTDLANPYVFPGSSLHDELGHFVNAGIPDAEALKMATSTSAEVLGVSDEYGRLRVGQDASFFLTSVNPLEDLPGSLANIEAVVYRGEHYDRAALDAMIEEAAQLAEAGGNNEVAVEKVEEEVIGELITEGAYEMKFGPWNAGSEEFKITKTTGGYRVYSANRPGPGPQSPSDTVYFLNEDRRVNRIEYTVHGDAGFDAVYTLLDEGGLTIDLTRDGEAQPQEKVDLEPGVFPTGPSWVVDHFASGVHGIHNLGIGDSVTFMGASFGFAGHRVQKGEVTVTRLENAEMNGKPCKVYESQLSGPMGQMTMTTHVGADRITQKSVLKMPTGEFSATLKD